jgi:hypothetical protein
LGAQLARKLLLLFEVVFVFSFFFMLQGNVSQMTSKAKPTFKVSTRLKPLSGNTVVDYEALRNETERIEKEGQDLLTMVFFSFFF